MVLNNKKVTASTKRKTFDWARDFCTDYYWKAFHIISLVLKVFGWFTIAMTLCIFWKDYVFRLFLKINDIFMRMNFYSFLLL